MTLKRMACVAAIGVAMAGPAMAQQAFDCEWQARADNIVEPWEQNTRTFANGDVRLALVDTVEPAAGGVHVLVISPPYSEMGDRQCRAIGMFEGVGFSYGDFSSLDASYDPSVGLIFTMNVRYFNSLDFVPARLRFTLNQATGAIGASLQ